MKLLVYGGAFDPLHNGHVDIIQYLLRLDEYDRLCVVPTGMPVYKPRTMFTADVRTQMLNVLFKDDPKVDICEYETERLQTSYTVNTVSYLMAHYDVKTLTLVVGFDQLFQFHRWREYDHILNVCDLLVIPRDGIDQSLLMRSFPKELEGYKHRFDFHDILPDSISSSRIRLMIQKGESIQGLVPDKILSIIQEYGGT